RMSLEIALVDLVQKLKEPSVSALVQKIERLKTAIETGKPFDDAVPQAATVLPLPPAIPEKKVEAVAPATAPTLAEGGLDTATVLQKAFLAEEVAVNPETEKLF
ncbi:MAG TPA: hypothetical protein PKD60_14320, partial [Turneriella sp.]|nr:hypothetical protein [Turneriella sp.]